MSHAPAFAAGRGYFEPIHDGCGDCKVKRRSAAVVAVVAVMVGAVGGVFLWEAASATEKHTAAN